jgi:dTDP-4-amino-4,6-dideoxygalactose transaminase
MTIDRGHRHPATVLAPEDLAPLRLARPSLPPPGALDGAMAGVLRSGMLSNLATQARRFEAACAAYTGLGPVRCVSSADVGLTLAVAALGLPRGSRALVPSFTFNSTVHALLWNGLEPVFADVDPETWCLGAEQAEGMLAPDVSVVVGTHAFTSACDLPGLDALAAERGVALLFDAAQAFATWHAGRHAAAFGDASVFSFSGSKIVTSGEGGAAVLRSPEADERFHLLRKYGIDGTYESLEVGLNGKLSELHAALGCLTVPGVEREVAARARVVARYRALLGPLDGVRLQAVPPGTRPTPTIFAVDVGPARDAVVAELERARVESRAYFRPLHAMPRFAGLPRGPLPVTERLGASVLALPLFSGMTAADVDRVCEAVARGLGR